MKAVGLCCLGVILSSRVFAQDNDTVVARGTRYSGRIISETIAGIKVRATDSATLDLSWTDVTQVEHSDAPEAYTMAESLYTGGQYQKAAEAFDKAMAGGNVAWLKQYCLYYKAMSCLKAGSREDARKAFEGLLADVPSTRFFFDANLAIASSYFEENKFDDAEKAFKKAAEAFKGASSSNPSAAKAADVKIAEARYWGVYCMEKRSDAKTFGKVDDQYKSLMSNIDEKENPVVYNLCRMGRIRVLIQANKIDEAQKFLEELQGKAKTKDKETMAVVCLGRGDCFWAKEEYEKARMEYLRVTVLYDDVNLEYTLKAHLQAAKCFLKLAANERDAKEKAQWHVGKVKELGKGTPWEKLADDVK